MIHEETIQGYGRWFFYLSIAIKVLEALPELAALKRRRRFSDFQLLKSAEIQVRLAVNLIYVCFDDTKNPTTGVLRRGLDFAAVCASFPAFTADLQGVFHATKTLRMNSFAKYDGSKGKTAWRPLSLADLLKAEEGTLFDGTQDKSWEYSQLEYVGVGAKAGLRFARLRSPLSDHASHAYQLGVCSLIHVRKLIAPLGITVGSELQDLYLLVEDPSEWTATRCNIETACQGLVQPARMRAKFAKIPAPKPLAATIDDVIKHDACFEELLIAWQACNMNAELEKSCFPSLPTALVNMCKWSVAFVTYNRAAKLVFRTKNSGLPEEYQHPNPDIQALRKPGPSPVSPIEELARQTMQHPTLWEKGLDISVDYEDGNMVVADIVLHPASGDCNLFLRVQTPTGITIQLNDRLQPGTSWERHQVYESIHHLSQQLIAYLARTMNMRRTLDSF